MIAFSNLYLVKSVNLALVQTSFRSVYVKVNRL